MALVKVVSWNLEYFQRALTGTPSAAKTKRRAAIAQEIGELNPDILCMLEAPKDIAALKSFLATDLGGAYAVIEAPDGQYETQGIQWIRFLVRQNLAAGASLQPVSTWDTLAGASWPVHYWGVQQEEQHSHYRHPQVLLLTLAGTPVEFIGLHLKSEFVNGGQQAWDAGGAQREAFVQEALKARIKLATEAANVRKYLDVKLGQAPGAAMFVMGDLNDGPGKDYFEDQYLFFDLVSNLQGDVFFARHFLNHALFDYPQDERWTVTFEDYVYQHQQVHVLLDHIMFTQSLVDGSLPLVVNAHAGNVEYEIHDRVNAPLHGSERTSDHRPISLMVHLSV